MNKFQISSIATGVLAAVVLLLFATSFTIVKAGERGVKTTLGKVEKLGLAEGLHFKIPFGVQDIILMDIKTKKLEKDTIIYTKDIQQAKVRYALNYNLNPDNAPNMYKTVGLSYQTKLVVPTVEGVLKDVMGKWNATDLISNREKATLEIFENLKDDFNKVGLSVSGLQVTEIDYDNKFEKAIEEKVIAQQKALTAKNKTVQIQEEANQKLISAEANAKAMKIQGDALRANSKLIDYELIKVKMEIAKKWKGDVPKVVTSSNGFNLMDISQMAK